MKYGWSENSRIKVTAEVAAATLDDIALTHGGIIKARDVVEASRPPSSPLHACFEWEDTKAAELYRRAQARQIIRSVRIIGNANPNDPQNQGVAIAYLNVTTRDQGRGYASTARVLSEQELYDQALASALAQFEALRRRYNHIGQLHAIFGAIDNAKKRRRRKQVA